MLCKCCDSPDVTELNVITVSSEPDIVVRRYQCLVCGGEFAIRFSFDANMNEYKEVRTIYSKGSSPLVRELPVVTGVLTPKPTVEIGTGAASTTTLPAYVTNKVMLEEAEELNNG
jgi:hypothetical protein